MTTTLSLKAKPTFIAPVPVAQPGDDKPINIEVTFKHQRKTDFEAWLKFAGEKKRSDRELVSEIVVAWSGPDVTFSPEALNDFVEEHHGAATEMVRVYCKQLAGIDI